MLHWFAFLDAYLLGLYDMLECSSDFKWQWYDSTGIYPAENHHMTSKRAWPLNLLLFVISREQANLKWDHLTVFSLYGWKILPVCSSYHPNLHPYVITCGAYIHIGTNIKLSKIAGNSASCPLHSWSTEIDCIAISEERYANMQSPPCLLKIY